MKMLQFLSKNRWGLRWGLWWGLRWGLGGAWVGTVSEHIGCTSWRVSTYLCRKTILYCRTRIPPGRLTNACVRGDCHMAPPMRSRLGGIVSILQTNVAFESTKQRRMPRQRANTPARSFRWPFPLQGHRPHLYNHAFEEYGEVHPRCSRCTAAGFHFGGYNGLTWADQQNRYRNAPHVSPLSCSKAMRRIIQGRRVYSRSARRVSIQGERRCVKKICDVW